MIQINESEYLSQWSNLYNEREAIIRKFKIGEVRQGRMLSSYPFTLFSKYVT